MELAFVKGHGTENDFVLLPDLDDRLVLDASLVAGICDRRAGLGADGVLRVAPAAEGSAAAWFMDYRNADGSIAEMCGNGIRVFARYLVESGLAPVGQVLIETRSGTRRADVPADGDVTVDPGTYECPDLGSMMITIAERSWPAHPVRMPNPHLVALVDDLDHAGDLRTPPMIAPAAAAPDGANVELVVRRGPHHVAMRVFERGVGETRSCGTGAAAAAVAAGHAAGELPSTSEVAIRVDVPGGTLVVTVHPDGAVDLTGPAVLVARGTIDSAWLAQAGAAPSASSPPSSAAAASAAAPRTSAPVTPA